MIGLLTISAYVIPTVISIYLTFVRRNRGLSEYSYLSDTDDYILGSLTPVVNLFVIINIISQLRNQSNVDIKSKLKDFNTIKECLECGIYSRKGYVEIYKLSSSDGICPHCHSERGLTNISLDADIDLPLSPKFTLKKIREFEKLKVKQKNNTIIDSQLEKYLELQQKKLDEMKG